MTEYELPSGVKLSICIPALGLSCDVPLSAFANISTQQMKERIVMPAIAALDKAAHERFDVR